MGVESHKKRNLGHLFLTFNSKVEGFFSIKMYKNSHLLSAYEASETIKFQILSTPANRLICHEEPRMLSVYRS